LFRFFFIKHKVYNESFSPNTKWNYIMPTVSNRKTGLKRRAGFIIYFTNWIIYCIYFINCRCCCCCYCGFFFALLKSENTDRLYCTHNCIAENRLISVVWSVWAASRVIAPKEKRLFKLAADGKLTKILFGVCGKT
jgi:hypothetical protein